MTDTETLTAAAERLRALAAAANGVDWSVATDDADYRPRVRLAA